VERADGLRRLLTLAPLYAGFQNAVGARRAREWFAARALRLAPGARVIDVGCGTADIIDLLPEGVGYAGFDPNPAYIARASRTYAARPNTSFLHGTAAEAARDPRFTDATVVICLGVMHHLDETQARELLKFAKRALTPEGRLRAIEPAWLPEQGSVSRWIMSLDRGIGIRSAADWHRLVEGTFPACQTTPMTGLIRLPYTHVYIDAGRSASSS
jgi:SAM-dependent methyltransferase